MLTETRSKYLFYFSVFMVVFYAGVGIMLSCTTLYRFENQELIGIAFLVYGFFRAARIWNAWRNSAYEE